MLCSALRILYAMQLLSKYYKACKICMFCFYFIKHERCKTKAPKEIQSKIRVSNKYILKHVSLNNFFFMNQDV